MYCNASNGSWHGCNRETTIGECRVHVRTSVRKAMGRVHALLSPTRSCGCSRSEPLLEALLETIELGTTRILLDRIYLLLYTLSVNDGLDGGKGREKRGL